MQLLNVFQDLAQVKTRFGGLAATILNNYRATLLGSRRLRRQTLDHFSRLIGSSEFEQRIDQHAER